MMLIFSLCLLFTACQKNELETFCANATAESFDTSFKVSLTGIEENIPLKHACPPNGQGISPGISWDGVPSEATNLHILVEDATCTYMCNDCCKYHHWQLDLPLDDPANPFRSGIPEGASKDAYLKKYMLDNSSHKREYMPFCPPKHQMHAIVVQLTAYHEEGSKKVIDGRSQSRPYLILLD